MRSKDDLFDSRFWWTATVWFARSPCAVALDRRDKSLQANKGAHLEQTHAIALRKELAVVLLCFTLVVLRRRRGTVRTSTRHSLTATVEKSVDDS